MNYLNLFESIKQKALRGSSYDIDSIMATIDEADLPITRVLDPEPSKNTKVFHQRNFTRTTCKTLAITRGITYNSKT